MSSVLAAGILVQGADLAVLAQLLELGIREATRRDGWNPPPRVERLRRLVAAAAAEHSRSVPRRGDVANRAAPAGLKPEPAGTSGPRPAHLTTKEASAMLGLSTRQVQRLTAEGELVRVRPGRPLLLAAESVSALVAYRREVEASA